MYKNILTVLICSTLISTACNRQARLLKSQAPDNFKAEFETTKGNFIIEFKREWSPFAVDRVFHLIKSEFYTDIAVFRVVPGFVAQFGISNDSTLNNYWETHKVPDESVITKNEKGTLSFARGGVETRTTQMFINLENNSPRLDNLEYSGVKGFPVIGKVIEGMEVVEKLYDNYGEAPGRLQGKIQELGNAYLKENFPELDYIKTIRLLKKKK